MSQSERIRDATRMHEPSPGSSARHWAWTVPVGVLLGEVRLARSGGMEKRPSSILSRLATTSQFACALLFAVTGVLYYRLATRASAIVDQLRVSALRDASGTAGDRRAGSGWKVTRYDLLETHHSRQFLAEWTLIDGQHD
ncbi:MAG: hypothetical protein U0992_20045 [Planctomycetaceae bacterium]